MWTLCGWKLVLPTFSVDANCKVAPQRGKVSYRHDTIDDSVLRFKADTLDMKTKSAEEAIP